MTDPTPVGYYEWLDFNSPMTDRTADHLVAELAAGEPRRVLDVGCGWGELLLRLLAACPEATGYGIDNDDELIDRARRNAERRGLDRRATFGAAPAVDEPVDTVVNIGAEHVFGPIDHAIAELWPLVTPGGRLLLGTQFWECPPTPDLVEAVGSVPTLTELVDMATATGWRPIDLRVATLEDWDHFEFRFLRDWEQLVLAPPTIEQADRAREAADRHRSEYLRRRGVLGFAYLILGRPA